MLASVATRNFVGVAIEATYFRIFSVPADHVADFEDVLRALGMGQDDAPRIVLLGPQQVLQAEDLVHHARAGPEDHLAAGHFLQVTAQVLVGNEQDFLVLRHPLDDFAGVAARDDPVAQALDGGRRVDVGDRLEVVALGAEFAADGPAACRRGSFPPASSRPGGRESAPFSAGLSILAVSAMKCTPLKTITDDCTPAASRDSLRLSPTKSATS